MKKTSFLPFLAQPRNQPSSLSSLPRALGLLCWPSSWTFLPSSFPQPARTGPAGGPLSSALLPCAPTPAFASTGPPRLHFSARSPVSRPLHFGLRPNAPAVPSLFHCSTGPASQSPVSRPHSLLLPLPFLPCLFPFFPGGLTFLPSRRPPLAQPRMASHRARLASGQSAPLSFLFSTHRPPIKPRAGCFPSPFSRPRSSNSPPSANSPFPSTNLVADAPVSSVVVLRSRRYHLFPILVSFSSDFSPPASPSLSSHHRRRRPAIWRPSRRRRPLLLDSR